MDGFNRATPESGQTESVQADVSPQPAGETVVNDARSTRQRTRDSLFLVASLRLGTETKWREVRVRNLSEGGLMVELDKIAEVGTPVSLDLRGIGEVDGKVAWCTEGRIGIALDTLIDPKKARKPVGAGKPAPIPLR